MDICTAKQLSEKWQISVRRITKLCEEGRIVGANKIGGVWLIPIDAQRPSDARIHTGKYKKAQNI